MRSSCFVRRQGAKSKNKFNKVNAIVESVSHVKRRMQPTLIREVREGLTEKEIIRLIDLGVKKIIDIF